MNNAMNDYDLLVNNAMQTASRLGLNKGMLNPDILKHHSEEILKSLIKDFGNPALESIEVIKAAMQQGSKNDEPTPIVPTQKAGKPTHKALTL
ncbi:MAG: hypothetical protein PHX43_02335 [Alphaproteobacteria bacterium]|nr:hypothetical protein [Alphaproteobacteria bacterium]